MALKDSSMSASMELFRAANFDIIHTTVSSTPLKKREVFGEWTASKPKGHLSWNWRCLAWVRWGKRRISLKIWIISAVFSLIYLSFNYKILVYGFNLSALICKGCWQTLEAGSESFTRSPWMGEPVSEEPPISEPPLSTFFHTTPEYSQGSAWYGNHPKNQMLWSKTKP